MHTKFAAICVGVSIALALPAPARGQEGPGFNQSFGRGKIILKDLTRFEARDLQFAGDTLSFTDTATGRRLSIPTSDVEWVSHKKNMVVWGAVTGGGLMLLSGLAAYAQVEADPYLETRSNAGTVIAGLTLGGAVVGALIGSAFSTEKTVYEKGRFKVSLALPMTGSGAGPAAGLSFARVSLAF